MMQGELRSNFVHRTQHSVYHHLDVYNNLQITAAVTVPAQGRHLWVD